MTTPQIFRILLTHYPKNQLREATLRKLPTKPDILTAIDRILHDEFQTSLEAIRCKTRRREVVYLRFAVAFILRDRTTRSLHNIGQVIMHDHATVLHGCRQVTRAMQGYDPELLHVYLTISSHLKRVGW